MAAAGGVDLGSNRMGEEGGREDAGNLGVVEGTSLSPSLPTLPGDPLVGARPYLAPPWIPSPLAQRISSDRLPKIGSQSSV